MPTKVIYIPEGTTKIYTHIHHIVPIHAGGSDDSANKIEITVTGHAEAHRILYEEHGRWQDRIAWQMLSGQISAQEATRQAQSLANKGNKNFLGKKHTEETKKKISDSRKITAIGNKNAKGHKKSDETKKILAQKSKGNTNKLGKIGKQNNPWKGRSDYLKKNNPMSDPEVRARHKLACQNRKKNQ